MDEHKRIEQLKERVDQTVFRNVHFTRAMEERVRSKIRRNTGSLAWRQPFAFTAALLLVFVLLWSAWPAGSAPGQEQAAKPSHPDPGLLHGGTLEVPDLWHPSPRTETTFENKPFTYLGERPVRILTDENGFYEEQQQRIIWLIDAPQASKVELVAYDSGGRRIDLGTYQLGAPLYDAQGHFPSGIALPDPGVWKLQVLADGKHLGQVFVQVQAGVSPANREMVEPIVRNYLETEGTKLGWLGHDRDVNIELLGVEAPDAASRKVYAWVKVLSKDPRLSSGVSAPMVFDIAFDGKSYNVTDMQMPQDGSLYQSSLQKLFPPKVLERMKSRE